jgi:hypothetical protein
MMIGSSVVVVDSMTVVVVGPSEVGCSVIVSGKVDSIEAVVSGKVDSIEDVRIDEKSEVSVNNVVSEEREGVEKDEDKETSSLVDIYELEVAKTDVDKLAVGNSFIEEELSKTGRASVLVNADVFASRELCTSSEVPKKVGVNVSVSKGVGLSDLEGGREGSSMPLVKDGSLTVDCWEVKLLKDRGRVGSIVMVGKTVSSSVTSGSDMETEPSEEGSSGACVLSTWVLAAVEVSRPSIRPLMHRSTVECCRLVIYSQYNLDTHLHKWSEKQERNLEA